MERYIGKVRCLPRLAMAQCKLFWNIIYIVLMFPSFSSTSIPSEKEYDLKVYNTRSIDGDDFMRATFVFKYRSKGKLLLMNHCFCIILTSIQKPCRAFSLYPVHQVRSLNPQQPLFHGLSHQSLNSHESPYLQTAPLPKHSLLQINLLSP